MSVCYQITYSAKLFPQLFASVKREAMLTLTLRILMLIFSSCTNGNHTNIKDKYTYLRETLIPFLVSIILRTVFSTDVVLINSLL